MGSLAISMYNILPGALAWFGGVAWLGLMCLLAVCLAVGIA